MSATPTKLADSRVYRELADRLRERGVEMPEQRAYEPTPNRETPEERDERLALRMEGIRARWARKVPAMYADAAVAHLDESQEAVRAQGWLGSEGLHLVLAGPVGTGKTYAAYAIGNQALARGVWTEAWSVGDLMDELRPGATSAKVTWDRARQCELLVLDDLTARATDWETERMTLLLDARVREKRRTIITTNITSAQITEAWGTRMMDRLSYRLTALTFAGESRRGGDW